jgi:hypothetical protein
LRKDVFLVYRDMGPTRSYPKLATAVRDRYGAAGTPLARPGVSDWLDVPAEQIHLARADTDKVPIGRGAGARLN